MTTYLAFLRAINLGAKRVFPKEDIRRAVESVGFEEVVTHINTGNVRFESRMRSRDRIERTLETAFLADRGFEVPTIVYSAKEFAALAGETRRLDDANPGLARHYVYLLKDELTAAQIRQVESRASDKGRMVVRGRAAHALLEPGYQDGTVDPLGAASLLGVATNRNASVVLTLAEKWCGE
ncbi:DUF1697 domain-containing protein [Microbacterium sp. NPDC091382]|uniref:DUF1697 domain-containing protein n=1 Tax=Microbacterium sp. NPDC091382 TaxID=3364210 RepID=UPI00382B8260